MENLRFEGDTAIWEINKVSNAGTYQGVFRFRCALTIMQLIDAGRDHRELLGPHGGLAPVAEDNLAYALAQLNQRVLASPPFWTQSGSRFGGAGVKDIEIVNQVLEAAIGAEMEYAKHLLERQKGALDRLKEQYEARAQDAKTNEELTK